MLCVNTSIREENRKKVIFMGIMAKQSKWNKTYKTSFIGFCKKTLSSEFVKNDFANKEREIFSIHSFTMVDNSQEYRLKHWATRSSVRSFTRTANSFACSRLLASLAPSTALTRSLARSLCSFLRSWDSE